MLLTKSTTFLIGPIASILGYIMNAIFWVQSQIGIANIGLCIILFTMVIYLLLMPLTIQQQRFSKLQSRMNPEIQAIQKKYKGKEQDQAAMLKMNEETKAVYTKYGVHPMGSCLQLLVQMPILFALYRVIWNIPAYVTTVRNVFMPLAEKLVATDGAQEILETMASSVHVSFSEMTNLTVIDVLYKLAPSNWADLAAQFPNISDLILDTQAKVDNMNYFLGLNIADSPSSIISSAVASGSYLLVVGALLIPILSALTQWINVKMTPTATDDSQSSKSSENDAMNSTMKTMNTVMPLMSAVFCFTLPVGMGLYWIAGAVIRGIQQVIINKKIDRMDIDEVIRKNLEKENQKRAKQGLPPQKITNTAKINTKTIETPKHEVSEEERKKRIEKSTEYYKSNTNAKPGSLAAKAQMVKQYNEKNAKK
jgi:YidC/Oxa1 family membrane protein insertase